MAICKVNNAAIIYWNVLLVHPELSPKNWKRTQGLAVQGNLVTGLRMACDLRHADLYARPSLTEAAQSKRWLTLTLTITIPLPH